MEIGQDAPIFIQHDAGAHAGLLELAFARHGAALPGRVVVLIEEKLEGEAVAERQAELWEFDDFLRVNGDDTWSDFCRDVGEAVAESTECGGIGISRGGGGVQVAGETEHQCANG